jgi:CHAT domain-containing protein
MEAAREELRTTLSSAWRERRERVAHLRHDLLGWALFGHGGEVSERFAPALFGLVETARAASASGPLRIGAGAAEHELLEELARRREVLGDLVAAGGAAAPPIEELTRARRAVDAGERDLARALAQRGLLPFAPVEADVLAAALADRSAVLAFTAFDGGLGRPLGVRPGRGELYFLVQLLTADGRLRSRLVPELATLERAVVSWRAAVGEPVDARAPVPREEREALERTAGEELLALLLGPWLDELGARLDTLHVCPEGALSLVPLDALHWRGTRLGDRLRVLPATSLDALLRAPSTPVGARRLLAVGGLDYGGPARRFPALPDSGAEIRGVAGLFERAGTSVLLEGAAAQQARVERALAASTHALFATHGWFEEGLVPSAPLSTAAALTDRQAVAALAPLSLCGLALSGANAAGEAGAGLPGLWTGEEIAAADLRSLELVVLSACDTNRGLRRAGVGVQTLQTALHAAGARRSLTSLWRVKTDYGRLLVERFFAAHLAGASAAEALWEAKRFLRDERGLPTRFWAGWTLSGAVTR